LNIKEFFPDLHVDFFILNYKRITGVRKVVTQNLPSCETKKRGREDER
jgi:hypothetical protein